MSKGIIILYHIDKKKSIVLKKKIGEKFAFFSDFFVISING